MTTTEIKTRPLMFRAEMVRKLLSGEKTQTRRTVKNLPERTVCVSHVAGTDEPGTAHVLSETQPRYVVRCPYGTVGDRLWVKETWAAAPNRNSAKPSELTPGEPITYRATYPNDSHFVWRSAMFMPRWASRLTLEIVDIRVQRVNEISEEDAQAEGVERLQFPTQPGGPDSGKWYWQGYMPHQCAYRETARDSFASLWDSINGKTAPFDSGPWVWALTLKQVNP